MIRSKASNYVTVTYVERIYKVRDTRASVDVSAGNCENIRCMDFLEAA